MIYNPSIAGSSEAESYTITDQSPNMDMLPPTAAAGDFFKDIFHIRPISSILTEDGEKVPYYDDGSGREYQLSFVMPKKNIVVS